MKVSDEQMTATPPHHMQVQAELLLTALSPNQAATTSLAKGWGVSSDPSWSAGDLIIQSRRAASMRGDGAFCKSVDSCIALAWRLAAQTCNESISDSALLSMRGLGLLTERIPSPDIHGGLFSAMLDLSASFIDSPPTSAERRRVAAILIPAWFKTLDKASRAQMAAVMKGNRLFAPADYFVGFAWAWRFGIDRAADYLGAMQEGLAPNVRLPLPKASECEVFANIIAKSLPIEPDAGYRGMIESIFHGMRAGPPALEGWAEWLAAVFAGLPHVRWLAGDGSVPTSDATPEVAYVRDQRDRPEPESNDPMLVGAQPTTAAGRSQHAMAA